MVTTRPVAEPAPPIPAMAPGRHNASWQDDVAPNYDPALDVSHEHRHSHIHHSAAALRGHEHETVVYSTGTTADRSVVPDDKTHDYHVQQRRRDLSDDEDVDSAEKGAAVDSVEAIPVKEKGKGRFARFYARWKIFFHIFVFLFFTGWWVASLVLHRNDKNWVIPFLLWLCVTLRVITLYVPAGKALVPFKFLWRNTALRISAFVPERFRTLAGALLTASVIMVGAFASPTSKDNNLENRAVSLFGLSVFILVLWATSRNRKAIRWHTVIVGMFMQFIIALFVLRTTAGYDIFNFVSELARSLLSFAKEGVTFLTDPTVAQLTWFLIGVLPAIIFFVALVQLLYFWGILQWFIGKFAIFFFWSMRVSGAEAVVAAASPFIGQGESAMLIRPFVAHLTMAELHQVMCSGFATIAGSVLVAYIGLGINPQALISSCVMSIPASLAVSKLRYPEEEETLTAGRVVVPDDDEHKAANGLHAFANGAWLGLKIAGMILATLLCIIALLGLVDGLLTWWGRYIGLGPGEYDLTVELIMGYVCYPIAFLLGVPRNGDLVKVGRLIGIKLIANEFVAYTALQQDPFYADLSPRSRLIATYALCGFANIGSLGTQIGVLSQLSPARSGDVSRLAVSALITGAISTLTSANIAGLLVTDQQDFFTPAGGL